MIFPAEFLDGEFLEKGIHLCWSDLLWAHNNSVLGWRTIVNLAGIQAREKRRHPLVADLAAVYKDDRWRMEPILRTLAGPDLVLDDDSKRKWVFLSCLWLYENRDGVENPLAQVAEIYADFDYPDQISHFIHFMPRDDRRDPAPHPGEAPADRLLRNWRHYLERERVSLSLTPCPVSRPSSSQPGDVSGV